MTHALIDARGAAEQLLELLAPACERIEIAGSIRRRKPEVKDIELVAVPGMETASAADLWGSDVEIDRLSERIRSLSDVLRPRVVEVHRKDGSVEHSQRVGNSYQALQFDGIPVDLFLVRPPADWGVIFALRTGPGDWNTKIVTDCKAFFRRVEAGQVWHFNERIPCPEEADFFVAVGQPWLDPWERRVERVRLSYPRVGP